MSGSRSSCASGIAAETQTADELYLARQRFTAAFHDSPVALGLFSAGPGPSVLLDVNHRLASLLGLSVDALRGHSSPVDFVHPDDRGAGAGAFNDLMSGKVEIATFEQRALRASGPPVACRVSLSLVRDSDGAPQYGLCHVMDITAERRDEERIALYTRSQGALASLGRHALQAPTWVQLAATTVPEVVAALEVDFACVLQLAGDDENGLVAGTSGFVLREPLSAVPRVLAARELPREWLANGARSAIVAPIGAQPRAWLVALSRGELEAGSEELDFVEAAAHLLALAEERQVAEADARRRTLLDPLTQLPNRLLFGDRVSTCDGAGRA